MLTEVKVPSVGESVTEALLAQWFKQDGDAVKKDEPLFVIETDKVTLEVVAEADGILAIKVPEGETVAINTVVATIDAAAQPQAEEIAETVVQEGKPPASQQTAAESVSETEPAPEQEAAPAETQAVEPVPLNAEAPILSPAVRRLAAETKTDLSKITATGPGGRITKGDVLLYLESAIAPVDDQAKQNQSAAKEAAAPSVPEELTTAGEMVSRKPMTPIRRRIAARLLEAKQNTAMLTTFNEIDMSQVQSIRKTYKEDFKEKHGISLGMMSFFIKASIEALKEFPQINSIIAGNDIVEHHYYHIGVAVSSERGLVVPVIRYADTLSFAQLKMKGSGSTSNKESPSCAVAALKLP